MDSRSPTNSGPLKVMPIRLNKSDFACMNIDQLVRTWWTAVPEDFLDQNSSNALGRNRDSSGEEYQT